MTARTTSNPRLSAVQDPVETAVLLTTISARLEHMEQLLNEAKEKASKLEDRIKALESKVDIVRGMWIAVGITSALLGILGVVTTVAVGMKRLFSGG